MAKEFKITSLRLSDLEKELNYLKTTREREIAAMIAEARSYGDLSENSEYDAAKNEQAKLYGRIAELESIMKIVKVVDDNAMPGDVVGIGSHVVVVDEDGDEDEYVLVSSSEADPMAGKISDESPIGAALLGQRVGAVVSVALPGGYTSELTVKSVTRK